MVIGRPITSWAKSPMSLHTASQSPRSSSSRQGALSLDFGQFISRERLKNISNNTFLWPEICRMKAMNKQHLLLCLHLLQLTVSPSWSSKSFTASAPLSAAPASLPRHRLGSDISNGYNFLPLLRRFRLPVLIVEVVCGWHTMICSVTTESPCKKRHTRDGRYLLI